MAPWRWLSPPRTGHRPKSDPHLRKGEDAAGGEGEGCGAVAWFLGWIRPGRVGARTSEAGRAGCAGQEPRYRGGFARSAGGVWVGSRGANGVAGVPRVSRAHRYPRPPGGRVRACWCTRATRVRGARLLDTPRVSGGRRASGAPASVPRGAPERAPPSPGRRARRFVTGSGRNQGHQQSRDQGVCGGPTGRPSRAGAETPRHPGPGAAAVGREEHTEGEASGDPRRYRRGN